MEGIAVTVIRAGKYKALADPNEPLSKAAEAQIQAMVDAAYGVFVDHVSAMRGRTYEYPTRRWPMGRSSSARLRLMSASPMALPHTMPS